MTILHFANCASLTYVPLYIVYKCTDLGEGGGGLQAMMRSAGSFVASQLLIMIMLASFIPDMDNKTYDLSQELMKIIIGMIEILAMSLVYQYLLRGERSEKVLALGLGWTLAESLFTRFFPMWFGARELEFEWTWMAMGVEANLSIAVYIAFARLISRWHTKNNDDVSKTVCRQVLVFAALLHGGLGGRASFLQRFSLPVALAARCVYTATLWFAAAMVFHNRPSHK